MKCPICGNEDDFTREVIWETIERLNCAEDDGYTWETEDFGDSLCYWMKCESCKFEGPPEAFDEVEDKYVVRYDNRKKKYYIEGPFLISGFEIDNFYFFREPSGKYMFDLLQVARATDLSELTECLVSEDKHLRQYARKRYEELTGKSYKGGD